jgi:predicted ABC-type ATPase
MTEKKLIVMGGPNGAGKTTAAEMLVPQLMTVREFVNADKIAAGLSPYNVESQAVAAGRLMLQRISNLLKKDESFIFESTLATKGFVKTLEQAKEQGYHRSLIYIWLPDIETAKSRVAYRVKQGGHNIPDKDIERRYGRSLHNLFHLYWDHFDQIKIYNGAETPADLIAVKNGELKVYDEDVWARIKEYA